jgi:hypothetical protein
MTKEEKIGILKKMMWLNFQENFNNAGLTLGLCNIFRRASNYSHLSLFEDIPELFEYRDRKYLPYDQPQGYWWPKNGRFIPWWERHKAIWKTIKHLKKS